MISKRENFIKLIYAANVRLPGGWAHGIQIMKTCEALVAKGIEVELITGLKKDTDEEIFKYYGIKTRFKITKAYHYVYLSLTTTNKFIYLLRTLSFFLYVKFYLLNKKYDLLYFRTHLAGLFFNNYYLEVHDLPRELNFWHRLAFKKAKRIIVLTSYLKKELVKANVDHDKIIIAADGVDLEQFNIDLTKQEAREKLNLPLNKKIIAYSGDLVSHDWKGVDILLESLKYLSDVLCILIGVDDTGLGRYKKNNLLITGRKSPEEVPAYLKAADVLILPNKKGNTNSEFYTSPLKLFEYMAAGRPIVASDLPSIREVLNEKNVVLVKPNNPEKLAQGIDKLLKDEILAKKLAEQALNDVKNFSWQKRADKIIKN